MTSIYVLVTSFAVCFSISKWVKIYMGNKNAYNKLYHTKIYHSFIVIMEP